MKLLTHLENAFKRATEGAKNLAALDVDQQYAELDKQLEKERQAEANRIRNAYPHGWFKMVTRDGSHVLSHYCPDCKTLSQGKVAMHCGSRKKEPRPEGWRLMLLPKTSPVIFV
jgi:Leu/Phe-tRNA-protein transferase